MSGIWDSYTARMNAFGTTKRETTFNREQHMLSSKLPDTLSFHTAIIDGVSREIVIHNSDNLNEKTIFSVSPNILHGGGDVYWMNNHWIITELDANHEVYTKAKMIQCNYMLKWINKSGNIVQQWCVIEDGTKYLTGEFEDRNFIVTRGDSRIAMTIARTEDTLEFNRKTRFLVGDPEAGQLLAYTLSKPLKVGWVYNNEGVYKFVLQEVASEDDDNHILGIANSSKTSELDSYVIYCVLGENNTHDVLITEPEEVSQEPNSSDDSGDDTTPNCNTQGGKRVWL